MKTVLLHFRWTLRSRKKYSLFSTFFSCLSSILNSWPSFFDESVRILWPLIIMQIDDLKVYADAHCLVTGGRDHFACYGTSTSASKRWTEANSW